LTLIIPHVASLASTSRYTTFYSSLVSSFSYAVELLVRADLVTTELDGEVRFWGTRSILWFLLAIWMVMNMESAFAVLATLLDTTAAGGLARVMAALEFGALGPAWEGLIAFELALLLLILWYKRVIQRSKAQLLTEPTG